MDELTSTIISKIAEENDKESLLHEALSLIDELGGLDGARKAIQELTEDGLEKVAADETGLPEEWTMLERKLKQDAPKENVEIPSVNVPLEESAPAPKPKKQRAKGPKRTEAANRLALVLAILAGVGGTLTVQKMKQLIPVNRILADIASTNADLKKDIVEWLGGHMTEQEDLRGRGGADEPIGPPGGGADKMSEGPDLDQMDIVPDPAKEKEMMKQYTLNSPVIREKTKGVEVNPDEEKEAEYDTAVAAWQKQIDNTSNPLEKARLEKGLKWFQKDKTTEDEAVAAMVEKGMDENEARAQFEKMRDELKKALQEDHGKEEGDSNNDGR